MQFKTIPSFAKYEISEDGSVLKSTVTGAVINFSDPDKKKARLYDMKNKRHTVLTSVIYKEAWEKDLEGNPAPVAEEKKAATTEPLPEPVEEVKSEVPVEKVKAKKGAKKAAVKPAPESKKLETKKADKPKEEKKRINKKRVPGGEGLPRKKKVEVLDIKKYPNEVREVIRNEKYSKSEKIRKLSKLKHPELRFGEKLHYMEIAGLLEVRRASVYNVLDYNPRKQSERIEKAKKEGKVLKASATKKAAKKEGAASGK